MPIPQRRMSFPALLVALLLALGGTRASAADTGARAVARRHFERGTTLYQEARYAEAAAAFEAAYQTIPNGVVLYNLGQCYQKLGDLQRAIAYYRDYLHQVPDAEDHHQVETLVANLEKRSAEEQRTAVTNSSTPLTPSPFTTGSGGEVARGAQPRGHTWMWVAAGAAGAAVAGAVTLGLLARSDSRELLRRPHERDEAQRLHDSALGRARGANLLYGTAGVAVLAGTALFFIEGSF